MADISKIKLPNEAEPRLVKDTEARNIASSKAADAVFIPANPSAVPPVEAKRGLVPPPPSTPGTAKFLREDCTWAEPTGTGGTSDYDDLIDKPQINSVTLEGNKTAAQLSLQKSIKVDVSGTATAIADSNNDTEFVAGSNVTIVGATSGADQGKITISATDTTYESKTAASGGTDVSLVTTGEKYTWNNKQNSIKVDGSAVADANHDTTFAEGSNVDITAENGTITISATDTTYSVFDTSNNGLVPAADGTGETGMFLKGDGTWATPTDTIYTGTGAIDVNSSTHVISVADGDTSNKGVVKTINSVGAASSASESLVVTEKAVASAIEALPEPMVFKGGITLTADSTVTTKCSITLPSGVSSIKVGYTFKVISIAASPTYTGTLKVGDTFVADKANAKTTSDWVENTDWSVIPSGDEPSGTVTEVAATDGITTTSGSAISSKGTVKLNMVSSHTITGQSASAITTETNRTYPVGLDASGKVAVNIPWTDTDTYISSAGFADDSTSTPNSPIKMTLTRSDAGATKVYGSIPKVSSSSAGVVPKGAAVSTQTQSTKFLREDGTWAAPEYTTDTNTTYTVETGTANGKIKVIPSVGDPYEVPVYGLGTAAYTASTAYAAASHNQAIGTITGISTAGTAVTSVSTTATASATGYISVSSYDSSTKTLTLKGILAPTESTFVKKS